MNSLEKVYKVLFTPVTIMLVPHSCKDALRLKIPTALILSVFIFSIIGLGYVISEDVSSDSSDTLTIVLIIAIVLLVLINLLWFFLLRKRLKK